MTSQNKFSLPRAFQRIAAAILLAVSMTGARAQSDNFDSGALASGWQVRNVLQALGGFVDNSFPTNGSGRALRLQRGSQPPGGTGRAWLYFTNDYADFYVAMDMVNWNNNTNQAIVLLARASGFDSAPNGIPGLGAVNGYVCNYDVVQDGTAAGDRLGGEFQINRVTSEAPTTLAAAEVTLVQGRSYRMIFTGAGAALTARLYDSEDLTAPLVTITATDATYATGKSGIATFHRDAVPNRTDMTVDNYFAAATDPNAGSLPAIAASVSGIPVVSSRTPARRFTNFHPAASGVTFTARTYTAGQIDSTATRLYLNDRLAPMAFLPSNGPVATFATAPGALEDNRVYRARIELTDTTGTLKSTNTFWFDTFTQGFLTTGSTKVIEAEDYNFDGGQFHLDPIPPSGLDTNQGQVNGLGFPNGFYALTGTSGIDYFKAANGFYRSAFAEYRLADKVQITAGSWFINSSDDEAGDIAVNDTRIHDTRRAAYENLGLYEFQVRLTSPGDWMNYTRVFAEGNYNVYLRVGSFGSTVIDLGSVSGDIATSNQTNSRLGSFRVSNHLMRLNYAYEPLMEGASPAVVHLSGTNTLRLTLGGVPVKDERLVSLDYLLFVPTTQSPTILDTFSDGNDIAGPVWEHVDPLTEIGFPASSYIITNGAYRLFSPPPPVPDAGQARASSIIKGVEYGDFYISADVIDFDDTVRQVFGLAARINSPGLQTTGGYLFTWEPGSGTIPTATNGDLDIIKVVSEGASVIETNANSKVHLTRGKSYRFAFMGREGDLVGMVYELPDTTNPLITINAHDSNPYFTGQVGLVIVDERPSDGLNRADATFDNFLATSAEPRLTVSQAGGMVSLSWPQLPFRLQKITSFDPGTAAIWADVTDGIAQVNGVNVHTTVGGNAYYRLVYP